VGSALRPLGRPLRGRRLTGLSGVVAAVAVLVAGAGCTPTTAPDERTGSASAVGTGALEPAADLSEELAGPGSPFIGEAGRIELPGYVEQELIAAGTATDYRAPDGLPPDGRWRFEPGVTAPYRTRVLVRRPADPARFSGTVVVEWLNVSGGLDGNPEWANLAEEIGRRGHAWVGVSAQRIGVEGGPVLVRPPGVEDLVGRGLVGLDPDRYGSLEHPGDGFSFDIFTQVARALRAGGTVLGGARGEVLLAAGESQSAIALTTYYNGVQPLTGAFEGFFVHSRAFAALPLVEPGGYADLAGSLGSAGPVRLRDDLDAPVLVLQAEGDVVGVLDSVAVRQPDTDRYRLWEVAGAAHADARLLGPVAGALDCGAPVNDAPMHLVAKAALRALETWVRSDEAPPMAPRLEVTDGSDPQVRRDADGIALGGLRTPPVDVPVDVLSGAPPPSPDLLCLLVGSTRPLPGERLAVLYPTRADYEQRYRAAVDATIDAGFVLPEDRDALLGYAQPSRLR